MATKSLSIRIEEQLLDKLHVVADYEGRSANSQILILIRESIINYENVHGTINVGTRISAKNNTLNETNGIT